MKMMVMNQMVTFNLKSVHHVDHMALEVERAVVRPRVGNFEPVNSDAHLE